MRKLSYSKVFKAILLSLAPSLVNVIATEIFEFSIYLLVVFQFMLYSFFFAGVKTLSWQKKEKRVHGKKSTRTTNQCTEEKEVTPTCKRRQTVQSI